VILERGRFRINLAPMLGIYLERISKAELFSNYIVIRLIPSSNTPAEMLYHNKLIIIDRNRGKFERFLNVVPADSEISWTFTCDNNYIKVIARDLPYSNLRVAKVDKNFNVTENIVESRYLRTLTAVPYSSCQRSDKVYVIARYFYPNYSTLTRRIIHVWLPVLYVIDDNDNILEEHLIGEKELAKCSIYSLKTFDIKTGHISVNSLTGEVWIPARIDVEYVRIIQNLKITRYALLILDPVTGYYRVQYIDSPIVSRNFFRKIVFDSSGNAYIEVEPNIIYVFDREGRLIRREYIHYLIDYTCVDDMIIILNKKDSDMKISVLDNNFNIVSTRSLDVDPTYLKDVYVLGNGEYVYVICLEQLGSLLLYVLEVDLFNTSSRVSKGIIQTLQYLVSINFLGAGTSKKSSEKMFSNLRLIVNSLLGKCIGWVGSELPVRKLKNPLVISDVSCFSVLGFGGFGVALLCVDESGRNVVVKLPRDLYDAFRDGYYDCSLTLHDYDSFAREAAILSRLDHIHVVKLLKWCSDPVFLMYEFCDGGDLRTLLSRYGKLSIDKVIILGIQVASALEHAYQNGVRYHGDLKPSNILFTRNGLLKVSDFGISRLASSTTGYTYPHGTLGYSAPEQLLHGLGSPGPRSDVFSLGVVMYEALTGDNPLKGHMPSEYENVLKNVELNTGMRELDELVIRMMSFRPDQRPDIDHVINRLAEIYVEYFS